MERHGTDDRARIERLELRAERTEATLSGVVDSLSRLERALESATTSTADQLRKLAESTAKSNKELADAIHKPTQWGTIAAWLVPALMIGGFLWGEIKLDQNRAQDRLAKIESSRYDADAAKRDRDTRIAAEVRLQKEIDENRRWLIEIERER